MATINFFRKTRSDKGKKRTGSRAEQSLASERDRVRSTRKTLEQGKSKLGASGQARVQSKIDDLARQSKALNSGIVQERRSAFIGNNEADMALTNPVARSGKLQSSLLKSGVGRQSIEKAKQAREVVKQALIKKAKQFKLRK